MTTPSLPGAAVSAATRAFLEARRFAVVATVGPDGSPHQTVLWYDLEGDVVLLNGADGRRWCRNLERDGRVTVAVPDGYDYVELRGRVEQIDRDQTRALADIEKLARRYLGDPAAVARSMERYRTQTRISYRFRPERIRERFGEG